MKADHTFISGNVINSHPRRGRILAVSLSCAAALLTLVSCTAWFTDEELKSESVLVRVPASQVCHTFFLPDEHRSYTLDTLELVDLMDSRLEGRMRNISIHEARNKFPSLKEPTRLPEGFELSSVIIDEKREENNRRRPYLPCSATLRYTPADSPHPWIEIGHPRCSPGDDQEPVAEASDWREVTVSEKPTTILDVEGRDYLSLYMFDAYTCLEVPRDSLFSDQAMIAIAESLERVKEPS